MINDKQITISTAGSRKATKWPASTLMWSELVKRLEVPVRGIEIIAEYLALPKTKQDDMKDVGGYVGGTLDGLRRKASAITGRDIVTLDLDNIQPGGTQDALRRVDGLSCGYAVYSTRKHEEARPRLRVLLPLSRTVTADEYEPLARMLASLIGIELCDPSTFEVCRLMYWPSCCKDSQYIFQYGDKPFLDADAVLAMYKDWHNVAEWPEVPGAQQTHVKLAAKQGDPLAKPGIVGAFCKVYDVYKAMDTLLQGEYEPCDLGPDRYTYTGGSTVGGAIVYDNGNFLYSHHATDPAGGKLCNAFDLVRLHKFAALDDDAKPDTPTNKMPSFKAMCELATADQYVANILNQERYENAVQSLSNVPGNDANWTVNLKLSGTTGQPIKCNANMETMLECDPLLKGKIRFNRFSNSIFGFGPLPWAGRDNDDVSEWTNADDSGLRSYAARVLGFRSADMLDDEVLLCAKRHSFDPVEDYLKGAAWDGIPRLDMLLIDYLGAEDCPYIRAVTRKAFTAAVARIMEPGCKFDVMTVIDGKQGIGKSTLISKMGRGWFSDSVNTLEGKEAAELLQGVWIVEIGELGAYSRSDIKQVKLFMSRQDDQYRAAYARKTEKHLRRCIFFGTTNDKEYLRDPTGNRRFWPVSTLAQKPVKSVFTDLNSEIDQIWAEAFLRWQMGEPLILTPELEAEADERRKLHTERDELAGVIEDFLERPIPDDWEKWTIDRRRLFWGGGMAGDVRLIPRDRVCVLEVWRECLNESRANVPKVESHRINNVLKSLPGLEAADSIRFGAGYGRQRGYRIVNKPC